MSNTNDSGHRYDVIIVGSGFSGVNMGIALKHAGIDNFIILEQADDVGGTWRDNVYPGCACDVPSHLYSYSFEPNPDWSTAYSSSDEIEGYIHHCVDKYGLRPHLKFGEEIVAGTFDASAGQWRLRNADGQHYSARLVVSAVGGLVNPSEPNLPGRELYTGKVMHTARWDRNFDVRGKRIAVVGTGASAIQVVPAIQPDVEELVLFQRTAPWIVPKVDPSISEGAKKLFHRFPLVQKGLRGGILALTELVFAPMVILDSPLQKLLEAAARSNLKKVKDPALREKLTPTFHIGCKRVLFSSDYYPAVQQDNVQVITDGIASFTETGLKTDKGETFDVDAVVLATGFRVDITNPPFEIHGLDDVTLADLWSRPGGKAYKGVAINGIPNFFMMLGPNTGPGHTSVLIYTEAQADYITQAVKTVLDQGLGYVNVKRPVLDHWHEKLQHRMRYTSWTSGCQSWYLDEHGENHTLFPGLATEYALGMRHFKLEEYEVG
ncbi:cyclohexanone monooxygenase [Alcanivorax hongdengensis A-11-3]|uniref:Cyclohexanone monooxygenase n=1 Tax=Alcanivorax hongdengensis A-11-3 TaxID=1177179 RepID=L0W9T1_9GAMM|nr:NAD(P)/FAD-dependent oxidoreductase [Alcanivorax hongdengensis]EKF73503.1 cyclohexanone monooxygenase [Alcanivorax hongdengensis A-11-3]